MAVEGLTDRSAKVGHHLDGELITYSDGSTGFVQTTRPYTLSSSANSTTTPLTGGATFTGVGELNFLSDVMVSCQTDDSGTLYFDFSVDGTNWTTFPVNGFTVASGIHEFHTAVKGPRYFRVRLVNDSGAQSYLRLYTYFGTFRQGNSPLNQTVNLDTDAAHVRPSDFQDEVRIGRRSGVTGWTKFGYRSNLTGTAGEETVWATTGNFTPMTAADTFNIAYDGTSGGSTDGSGTTGATQLTFYYIDADGNEAITAHNLGTDGTDTTSFTGLGINRLTVSASGTNEANVSAITITDTSGGTTQAIIPAGESVTQQCIFFVGSNHDAVAKFLYLHVNKPGGGNASVQIKGYAWNRAIATTFEVFRTTIDTSVETTETLNDPIGFALNPQDVLFFTANTSTNAAEVVVRFSLNHYRRV
jgi:hypothetical protein